MTFWTRYHAVCEFCGAVCEFGDNSHTGALISARQVGWQGEAKEWRFGGVETAWDFYCPTHRTDLE